MHTLNTARRAAALALFAALAAVAAPAAAQRQAPPAPMPSRPLQFPAFRETTLPNGMRLVVVENHAHPVASVSLLVASGSSSVPAERAGLAGLFSEVLTRGTATRTGAQIAETIERTGGSLTAGSGQDYTAIYASVLSDQLPLAFDLLSDVALRPAFPEEEVVAARDRALSELQQWMADPSYVADRRLAERMYGSHPYARYRSPQTLGTIDRQAMVDFHRAAFHPSNALLVVAGDVSAASVEEMARRHFGSWARGRATEPAYAGLPARRPTRILLSHRPGAVQSSIRAGTLAVKPGDPDYPALLVLNKVLGGGSDARLFNILREQKGWTYGAYTDINRVADQGRFMAGMEARTAVTDSAVAELMSQVRRIATEPISQAELDAAKGYLIGSFPLQIQTAEQVAQQVAMTRLLGLPVEDLLQRRERLAAVTVDDVRRVAARYLRADSMTVVVVGDATQVLSALEAIGPVDLVDAEGKPLDRSALVVRASGERFDIGRLRAGSDEYQITAQGNPVGRGTYTLAREGEGWKRSLQMSFGPVQQTLEARFGPAWQPIAYEETYAGAMEGHMKVTVQNGRITGGGQLPPQAGGAKTYDVEAVAGAAFSLMDEAMLSTADLAAGKTIVIPVFNSSTGVVAPVTYSIGAAESVTVPAGTFQAFKVNVTGGSSPLVLWLRAEGPHIVLRQEVVGAPIVVELTKTQ